MDNFIKMSSLTQAFKARDVLLKYNIVSFVKRISGNRHNGCSYGIVVKNLNNSVYDILNKHNIQLSGRALDDDL